VNYHGKFNLQVFAPVNLNSGEPAPPDALAHVERVLCKLGGGATITDAVGVWHSPEGRTYREPVRIVETDAVGVRAVLWRMLAELAQRVGRELDQVAVYVRMREIDAEAISITRRD
jgi:hypothetical protein